MEKLEQEFYKYLKPKLIGHVQRLESGSTAKGIPDLNICYAGCEVWVELKAGGKEPLLRKEQYAWGIAGNQAGRRCFVLFCGDDDVIKLWKFPDMRVVAVGESAKYVRIQSGPYVFTYKKQNVTEFLITNLFTPTIN